MAELDEWSYILRAFDKRDIIYIYIYLSFFFYYSIYLMLYIYRYIYVYMHLLAFEAALMLHVAISLGKETRRNSLVF